MFASATAINPRLQLNKSSRLGVGERLGDLTAEAFRAYGAFVGRNPGKLFVPLDAPVRFEFESQKVYDQIPGGQLDVDPPPSLIATPHSTQVSTQQTANELRDIPRRFARAIKVKDPSGPQHHDILRFYVVHKKYENLLVSDTLAKLFQYTQEMMNVKMEWGGEEWILEDFCRKNPGQEHCNNDLNIWLKHAENLFKTNGSRNNPNLQLSYPVMYLFNRPKDIGNIIYGVNVTGLKHEIVGARVLTIHWFITFPNSGDNLSAYYRFRDNLNGFWDIKTEESNIKFIPHNEKAMDDELKLIIETAIPFVLPATIQLMFFVYFTNLAKDVRKSKPVEAFFGVISVCLSLGATFGIIFFVGIPFNPVSSTMPFLILADAFLLLGAWRMTDPRWSLERRMGVTMSDAGASITVTSLTNFGCFALGYFLSPTPAVADFCIMTAVGVAMDYFYQITFFASIMVYGGMREEKGGMADYFKFCRKNIQENNLQINQQNNKENIIIIEEEKNGNNNKRLTDELHERK
uniref:SSD domain-containing protein n=1 Tax=Meloidogyne hapla TaxID=6305 RepID=A0A1I8BXL4_MELHA